MCVCVCVTIPDFGCGYDGSLLQHGRLFFTPNYICFYSSLFGSDVKVGTACCAQRTLH